MHAPVLGPALQVVTPPPPLNTIPAPPLRSGPAPLRPVRVQTLLSGSGGPTEPDRVKVSSSGRRSLTLLLGSHITNQINTVHAARTFISVPAGLIPVVPGSPVAARPLAALSGLQGGCMEAALSQPAELEIRPDPGSLL
ncbi:hypothetical protein ILYODFUR_012673 [Ilyodon furcidens]|uniref:Uncharacterized protein n=1 Tax=Ilyodon furcidens TaxID=33524 RepID=A0ABV0TUG9_9TELE